MLQAVSFVGRSWLVGWNGNPLYCVLGQMTACGLFSAKNEISKPFNMLAIPYDGYIDVWQHQQYIQHGTRTQHDGVQLKECVNSQLYLMTSLIEIQFVCMCCYCWEKIAVCFHAITWNNLPHGVGNTNLVLLHIYTILGKTNLCCSTFKMFVCCVHSIQFSIPTLFLDEIKSLIF